MPGYFGIYYGKHIAAFGPFLTCQRLLDSEKLNCVIGWDWEDWMKKWEKIMRLPRVRSF